MRVLLTGDSHLVALGMGDAGLAETEKEASLTIDNRPLGSGAPMATRFFKDCGDHAQLLEPSYVERFGARLPPEEPYDIIGFSGPLHTVRLWGRLTGFCSWRKPLPDRQLLSDAVLAKIIEDDTANSLQLLELLKRTRPVFVIESPRPFRHHTAVEKLGAEQVAFFDEAYRAQVKQELARRDIPLIEVEPGWSDDAGFTHPSLGRVTIDGAADPHHGNAEFGGLMMRKIRRFLAERQHGPRTSQASQSVA